MKITFWGTRGSLPAPCTAEDCRAKIFKALEASRGVELNATEDINRFIDEKLPFAVRGTYGTNTSCLELDNTEDEYVFCDAGSGIRDFASKYMKSGLGSKPATFHIIITHLHWDHIAGFPFFTPAYIPGNRIIIHTYHEKAEEAFKSQMDPPCFPVPFSMLNADIEFRVMPSCQPFQIGSYQISAIEQKHPGISYGYRFEKDGKVFVHSTDSEHKEDAYDKDYPFIKFFENADLVVFDAQYSLADATFSKSDWGHSSNVMGVELAARAKVNHLCMFHNEPTATDSELDEFLHNTHLYADIYQSEHRGTEKGPEHPKKITLAYDGLVVEI